MSWTDPSGQPSRPLLPLVALAAAWAAALGVACAEAWFGCFSTFVGYDDEGYFLMTTRFMLEGWPLYDDVPSFYGPSYYALRAFLNGLLGLPNTNESARYAFIALWILTSALCGTFAGREARQPWLGIVAFLLTFHFLRVGRANPGHPEMLVTALLAALPVVAGGRERSSPARMAALGILCAAVALMKVNAGVLAALAVLVAACAPGASLRRVSPATLLALATAALPPALMRSSPGLQDLLSYLQNLLTYSALVSGSFALAWLAASRAAPSSAASGAPGLGAFVLGGLGASVLLLAWLLFQGSTLSGLIRSTVVIPQRLVGVFHSWPQWPPLPPYAFGLAVAGLAAWSSRGRAWPDVRVVTALRLILFGIVLFSERFQLALFPGRQINLVFSLAPFLAWVVLIPPRTEAAEGPSSGRRVLAFLACLQILLAYPIPGSQVLFASVWMIPLAVVALGDALRDLPGLLPSPRLARRLAWSAVVLLILATLAREARLARAAWLTYHGPSRLALGLPGSGPLRLPESQVATYRSLVANLRTYADRCLSTVGSPSLHAWSGVPPPTHLIIPNSLRVLDDGQARVLLAAIERHPRFVLLRRQRSFLSPRLDDRPGSLSIVDELDRRFRSVGTYDGWEIQVRRERADPPLYDALVGTAPDRFALRPIFDRPATVGRITARDAETGRDLGRPKVRDTETGAAPRYVRPGAGSWAVEVDSETLAAIRHAAAPVLRVEAPDGRWPGSFPWLDEGLRSAGIGPADGVNPGG